LRLVGYIVNEWVSLLTSKTLSLKAARLLLGVGLWF